MSRKYETDAEDCAYWTGWRDRNDSIDELHQVRKIACALIRSNPNEAMIDAADMAWTLWRAIKAGQ